MHHKTSSGAAGPVRHGHGDKPIDEQARNYTVDCLQKIYALLDAQKTKEGDDTRLQFAAAKFLLELGWGRTPLRAIANHADELMTPEEQAKLLRFVNDYERVKKIYALPIIDYGDKPTVLDETT